MEDKEKTLLDYLKEFYAWLRKQPAIGPLLNILHTRKGAIATFLTLAILKAIPDLIKVHTELEVVVGALVTIVVIWLTTSLGYAYEDAAAKSAGTAVINTVSTPAVGSTDTKTTIKTESSVSTEPVEESDDSKAVG